MSTSHTLTGLIHTISPTQQVNEKFNKREFVLKTETETQYPQYVSLQFTQDKCSLLDNAKPNDKVTVSFNIRGREWNGPQGIKYFNTLEAWKIELNEAADPTPLQQLDQTMKEMGHKDADPLPF